ncbi:MAG: hypothetical protein ACKVH8_13805 [Pirellulales bacterium]|jgi:hypothetical protein
MKNFSLTLLTLFVVSIFAASQSEAAIFGRRKERIKAEVYSQLNATLSSKLDKETEALGQELSQGVDAAKKEIQAKATQQINTEANALEKQVADSIVAMQKKAVELVAIESKRLQQQTEIQIAELQKAAQAKIANESKKLQQLVNNSVAKITDVSKSNAEVLRTANAKQLQAAQATITAQLKQEMATVPDQVKADLMPQLLASLQSAIDERLPVQPVEEEKPAEDQAVLTPEVRVEEEAEAAAQ